MHLRFSNRAEADLDSIFEYITLENPNAAQRVVDSILLCCYQLESFPFLGRPGRVGPTREISVPRTPYFIVYTIPDDYHIDIEAIIHERKCYPPMHSE